MVAIREVQRGTVGRLAADLQPPMAVERGVAEALGVGENLTVEWREWREAVGHVTRRTASLGRSHGGSGQHGGPRPIPIS